MKLLQMKDRALELDVREEFALGDRKRRFMDWNGIPWEKCQAHGEWYAKRNDDEMVRANRNPGELWADATGQVHPHAVHWTEGAMFTVRAETRRQRQRDFYWRRLYLFVNANPEVGHFTKRVWYAFLSERNVERSRNEHRDENVELVTCKLAACKSHDVS